MSGDQMRFFDEVYGDSKGLIDVVTWDENGEPSVERWLNWPEDRDFIEKYVFELRGGVSKEDVYTSVNLFSGKARTKADTAAHTRVVGVDADTCDPALFRVPPSAVVESSPGRYQVWWFLDEEVSAAQAALTAQRISKFHYDAGHGCDKPGTHTVSKILRVPGTWNNGQHTEEPFQLTVSYNDDQPRLTLDTLDAVYSDVALGADVARQEATTTADFDPSLFNDEEMDRLREYARVSWENDIAILEREMVPGSWHTTGYRIACNMFRNANVVWSEYTHNDAVEVITRIAEVDSSESQVDLDRIFRDARREVGDDSLAMPAWALDLLPDLPPELLPKKDLPELEQAVTAAGLSDVYTKALGANGSQTLRTHDLAKGLFRAGLNARQVFTLAMNATANSFKNKRPASAVWKDVQWAMEAAEQPDPEPQDAIHGVTFLSDTERAEVAQRECFIDRYVKWVASRTDAAETYSRSLGWVVLSAVYADKGYIPFSYEDAPLNLFVLILGDTTETRKSTSKNKALQVIHKYEDLSGIKLDIGSDSTAEALKVELGKRNGQTSILHVDEVNEWFNAAFTKNYQSGLLGTFTELYDGKVPVTLRATKGSGNRERADTQFIFLGVGIRRHTAEVLTKRNFESGFLARMLWAVADPPPWRPDSEDVSMKTGDARRDDLLDDLLDELFAGSTKFAPGEKVPIVMYDDVLARFNEFVRKGHSIARKFGDGEVLKPSFARMKTSVGKAAALLAMHEGYREIQMIHLLTALEQAERWFKDMVRMASEVSSSEYERRLDEVESFIACGTDKMRTDQIIRKQFGKFRPQEMDEILRSLVSQGRLRKAPDNAKKWEVLA